MLQCIFIALLLTGTHISLRPFSLIDTLCSWEPHASCLIAFEKVLHVESRIASAVGEGFYTIGPGGEELLAAVGLVLKPTDPVVC